MTSVVVTLKLDQSAAAGFLIPEDAFDRSCIELSRSKGTYSGEVEEASGIDHTCRQMPHSHYTGEATVTSLMTE